jgi:hypothetical protein
MHRNQFKAQRQAVQVPGPQADAEVFLIAMDACIRLQSMKIALRETERPLQSPESIGAQD